MAAPTAHVFVSVPKREGFKGLYAIGRFFEDGKTGPHTVTAAELAQLRANSRLAVEPASPEEVAAGAALTPQTSAVTLSVEERELLESFRSAARQKVEVTLVRVAELDQAYVRAAELEAQAKGLEAQTKKTLDAAQARIAELEQQLKAAEAKASAQEPKKK